MRCITVGGPGWVAHNADCEDIKDFFRSVVSMELRQSGERVATKSVLWSYTALRDFVRASLFFSYIHGLTRADMVVVLSGVIQQCPRVP